MVQFYRDMWNRRSYILAPSTNLICIGKTKSKLTEVHQKAMEDIKKVTGKETILNYPNFNEIFEIHTDASNMQLGAVISRNGSQLVFYSRKQRNTQRNYTTTKQELLSIMESFKELRHILLGQRIKIFTDHKN